MTATSRQERYTEVAQREIESCMVREPQWSEALREAGGDFTAAEKAYAAARVDQILDFEREREAAENRLRRLRAFHDSLAPFGMHGLFLVCMNALITLLIVCIAALIALLFVLPLA
jgi:hypothetical protein